MRNASRGVRAGLGVGAALVVLGCMPAARAADLPQDIWDGNDGGFPSITANAQSGVSVTLPAEAVAQAGGSLAQVAKGFLDKWAPTMCSHVFDFQSAHKGLKVGVAVTQPSDAARGVATAAPAYQEVTIDYEPSRHVTCVDPQDFTS